MLKIRIRTKLAAALAVPLVALVGISGFEAAQASAEADDVRRESELATVSIGPSSLTAELQNERNYTALDLIGLADAATLEVGSVAEARERVDDAVAQLRAYVSGHDAAAGEAFAAAFALLDGDLEDTRELWDEFDGDKDLDNEPLADEVFERLTAMTEAFFDATESLATEVDDSTLRNGIEIVDNANRRSELLANLTRLIVLDLLTDGGEDLYRSNVSARIARLDTTEDRIEQLSVGPYAEVASETLDRAWDVDTREFFDAYLADDDVEIDDLLTAVSAGGAEGVISPAERAATVLQRQATELSADADERRQQFVLLAAGVIVLAIVSSWLASRSITRPLRRLRVEAAAMAEHRLPDALRQILETPLGDDVVVPELEPIDVKTRDEVREVVDVLNDVQDRTLALAADQAVLRRNIADSFVNLGRRNQNLLDRQLEFITELEQNETDADELESLFRLDHLATRMRRNAESLLVLAGVESPRQWAAPVSVDDVVRAALGEVEDYQRVTVRHLDPAMLAGSAASGISHVLAELLENALHYSPPGSTVEIKGRQNSDGYMLAIDDDGIGMSAEDLERANRRLSGEESYTVAPSRYLGHYVAGNLATRFGIDVRLQDRPAGGVTATVAVPTGIIEADPLVPEVPTEASPGRSDDAPASLAQALGRSDIDEIETADDLTRAIDGPVGAHEAPAPTGGLPRRVPGAQRPDLNPVVVRRTPGVEPEPDDVNGDGPVPEGVFGFFSGFAAAGDDTGDESGDETPEER